MIKSKLYVLAAVLCATAINAQVSVSDLNNNRVESDGTVIWQQVSCGNGGMSNTIRFHPTIPHHVTMMGDMWCAYRSTNNGQRWYSITDHDGDGDFNRQRDLIYSPSNPEMGLSICGSHLYHSLDTGRTWQVVKNCPWYELGSDGLDRSSWKSKVGGLGMDPNNKDVWFVGGGKFVRGDQSFSCYENITQAEPHGYRADNEGKLWRSKDGGKTWKEVGGDLHPMAQTGPVKINPRNSNQVFAATNYGLYKSEDGGDSWINIGEGKLDNNILMDLDYYYNAELDTFILYVIDQVQYHADGQTTRNSGGVFQSTDEGETWEKINGDLYLDFNRLASDVQDNYYKYIALWFGISKDVAKERYPVLPTKGLQHFTQLTTDPSRMGALYMGLPSPQTGESILPGRLWTTDNNGEKWTNCARLYTDVWAQDSSYWNERGNPWQANMTLGHESEHMGWGWNYAQRAVRGLDCGVDGTVMMLSDHTTSRSLDHGKTWHQVDEDFTPSGSMVGRGNSDLPGHELAMDKRQEQTYLGSGEHRLFITTDDSPDERQAIKNIMSSVETVSAIAFDPFDGDKVYTTSSRQGGKQYLWRSIDGGQNWSKFGVATPATDAWEDDFYTNALTIDPIDSKYMYHGVTRIVDTEKANDGGFFRSENGGRTFSQSNSGLPNPARIRDIQFDPRDTSRASLFAAAEKYVFNYHSPLTSGGLYHSTDRGKNWTKVNTPSNVGGVNKIRFDHTGRMYITTGYRSGGAGLLFTDDYGKTWHTAFSYPRVENFAISPFDHNLIAVTARFLSLNPGVFVSRDRGKTWHKSNTNIVVPQQVEDILFDIHDGGILWAATLGTGFYKGRIKNGDQVEVVNVSPSYIQQEEGEQVQLTAHIVNPDYAGEKIVWKSANPSVATVDENGVVTPIRKGSTKIWATAVNGRFSDYAQVSYESFEKFSLINNDTTVNMGDSFPIKLKIKAGYDASTLSYHSTDTMVAKLVKGEVVAGLIGNSTISVSSADGKFQSSIEVTVEDPEGSWLIATPDTARIDVNDTVQTYIATVEKIHPSQLVYLSRNKAVADVTSDGKIIGLSAGTAEIMVYWKGGSQIRDYIQVEVTFNTSNTKLENHIFGSLYPNPVKVGSKISMNIQHPTLVRVYDVNGSLKMSKYLTSDNKQIDTSGLSKGIYYVHIENMSKSVSKKLILR